MYWEHDRDSSHFFFLLQTLRWQGFFKLWNCLLACQNSFKSVGQVYRLWSAAKQISLSALTFSLLFPVSVILNEWINCASYFPSLTWNKPFATIIKLSLLLCLRVTKSEHLLTKHLAEISNNVQLGHCNIRLFFVIPFLYQGQESLFCSYWKYRHAGEDLLLKSQQLNLPLQSLENPNHRNPYEG